MLLDGAFTVLLLLLVSGASAEIVLPPTNVTVSCKNSNVTVSWTPNKEQLSAVFRVTIRGATGQSVKKTTGHHFDLTDFVWASEKRYMDNFYVTVAAMQGGNQSEPVPSKTFSFNTLKTTDITCELDFPPVDLNLRNSGATVSFGNPFHFNRELKQADKSNKARLKITVSTNAGQFDRDCTMNEELCKYDVLFPDGVEKCITLEGWLYDGIGVGHVPLRKTKRICVSEPSRVLMILLAVLLSIVALVVAVILVLICLVKGWTMKPPDPLPWFLRTDPSEQGSQCARVDDPDMDDVSLMENSRGETKPTKNLWDSACKERGYLKRSNQQLDAVGLIPEGDRAFDDAEYANGADSLAGTEGDRTDDDSADDSAKTECVSMDLEEVEVSEEEEEEEERELVGNYDHPHNLHLEVPMNIGNGEMITTYRVR